MHQRNVNLSHYFGLRNTYTPANDINPTLAVVTSEEARDLLYILHAMKENNINILSCKIEKQTIAADIFIEYIKEATNESKEVILSFDVWKEYGEKIYSMYQDGSLYFEGDKFSDLMLNFSTLVAGQTFGLSVKKHMYPSKDIIFLPTTKNLEV